MIDLSDNGDTRAPEEMMDLVRSKSKSSSGSSRNGRRGKRARVKDAIDTAESKSSSSVSNKGRTDANDRGKVAKPKAYKTPEKDGRKLRSK